MNINVKNEYNKTNIHDILKLLDEELVGLKPVKTRIKEISSLLLVDIMWKKLRLLADLFTYVIYQKSRYWNDNCDVKNGRYFI
tara:strand:+ start:2960 stop:3208 length:249 start_codon:yes stop_codon:yes gene_type:complete